MYGAGGLDVAATPPLFPFYPMAGKHFEDVYAINFVDLDPTTGVLDWSCSSTYSYNAHPASDTMLRTFGEQAVGVPVFAALDGVVIAADDGHFDMVTNPTGSEPANYVSIDHGFGRVCNYFHLKNGSVAVGTGDTVTAGQQIGLVGSSGISNYPHLHFSTYDKGVVYEPYAGPCDPGASGWVDQVPAAPLDTSTFLMDFAFCRQSPAAYTPPDAMPRTGQVELADPLNYWWIILPNLPPLSSWKYEFVDPSGATRYTRTGTFPNSTFKRWSWWWWSSNVIPFYAISGTWTLRLHVNGALVVEAPLEAVSVFDPSFGRPPEPITVTLLPRRPLRTDVLTCSVEGDPILDDLDYDVVRYRYEWSADGVVVRDVITAARRDVLPAVAAGVLVSCRVTPSDGGRSGSAVSASVRVRFGTRSVRPANQQPKPVTF
jgi:hypothetical protein